MGLLIIITGGIIGVGSAGKLNFIQCWTFLVNSCFALYAGLFLSPLIIPLLQIPSLDHGFRVCLSVLLLFFVVFSLLSRLTEQVLPNRTQDLPLPAAAERTGTLISAFLSGGLIAAFALYCITAVPQTAGFPWWDSIRKSAGGTLLTMIRTVNTLSLQTISPEGRKDLTEIGVIYAPPAEKQSEKAKKVPKQPKP